MSEGGEAVGPPRARRRGRLATSDYQALGAFRHALRKFLAFSESGARGLGLSPQQHQALLAVRAHPGPDAMTVGGLAESLLIKNHSALGLVSRLTARGLLRRYTPEQDRRRVALELTEEGAALLETISRSNLMQLKRSLPAFADLFAALERLEAPLMRDVAQGDAPGTDGG